MIDRHQPLERLLLVTIVFLHDRKRVVYNDGNAAERGRCSSLSSRPIAASTYSKVFVIYELIDPQLASRDADTLTYIFSMFFNYRRSCSGITDGLICSFG